MHFVHSAEAREMVLSQSAAHPDGLGYACMSAKTDCLVCDRSRFQESHLIKEGSSSFEQIWYPCPNVHRDMEFDPRKGFASAFSDVLIITALIENE